MPESTNLEQAAKKIEDMKRRLGMLKTEKTRLEAALEEQTRQYDQLKAELAQEGLDPERLDEALEAKTKELAEVLVATEKSVAATERELEELKRKDA